MFQKYVKTIKLLILLFTINFILIPSTFGVMNGRVALGDKNTIAIFQGKGATQNYCSGVYIKDRIAATAAHCLLTNQVQIGKDYLNFFKYDKGDIYVSEPGIDWKQSPDKRVKVLDYFIPNPYVDKWENSFPGRERDIAFLFLEKDFPGRNLDGIASKELMETLKALKEKVIAIGYGNTSYKVRNDGIPYSALHEARFREAERPDVDEMKYLSAVGVESGSTCPGDSGGAMFYEKDEKRYLVGIIFGGGTFYCHFGTPHNGPWSVESALAWPYEQELVSRYSNFLEQESKSGLSLKEDLQEYQCKKGKKIKEFTSKNKKCPKGFKKVNKKS